jgi:aldehyde dehydrogenase (NAD+)
MIVPRARQQEALDLASQAIGFKLGDPMDSGTRLGPLISSTQRERVEGFIAKGKQEGARVVMGGGRPATFPKGYYVEPTIFAEVKSKMTIAQEEIFGPVLSVLPYDTDEEVIRIANDTIYGLPGAVWSGDPERAMRVARRMRTGQVDVNGGKFNPLAPFGGYKQSGIGREMGLYGLEEYPQVKSIAR